MPRILAVALYYGRGLNKDALKHMVVVSGMRNDSLYFFFGMTSTQPARRKEGACAPDLLKVLLTSKQNILAQYFSVAYRQMHDACIQYPVFYKEGFQC